MRVVKAECGHRDRKGMIQENKCRECRGTKGKKSNHVVTTDDPHVAQRSRQRIIDNAVNQGGKL